MKLTEESILQRLRKTTSRPMKISELVKQLSVPDDQRREFRNQVKEMATKGSLVRLRGGRYGIPDEMNLVSGILQGNRKGFGFVVPDKIFEEEDVYVSQANIADAMHGDRVTVRIESHLRGERPEGRIIRVLERNTESLLGIFEQFGGNGWVVPMDDKCFHEVFVPAKNQKGAKPGQIVDVKIETYPTKHQPPMGRVVEVLGNSEDPEVEIKSIFRKYGVRQGFPPRAVDEAEKAAAEVSLNPGDNRTDLTGWMIFTIDGEKAKDFDDAVSIETLGTGYRLGVHIADVSQFIPEGSVLDGEALERGTSIYYPDGVIPMLPFQLSNEVCSLKPEEKRLALSVLIDFDLAGTVVGSRIFPSVIQSRYRFTYTQVARLLEEGDPGKKYGPAMNSLKDMLALSRKLRKKRFQEGSVDFNIPEPEVIFNEKGGIERIVIAEHNRAHEIIEEFMLAANQAVARYLLEKNVPIIHRIHEPPDEDKVSVFQEFIVSLGLRLRSVRNVRSIDLQHLLERVRNRPEERTINILLLRTMKKALYSENKSGHFGLGFEDYTHFTSPIRRYPDLVIHRLVKAFLKKRKCSQREKKHLLPRLAEFAEQSSHMEQKAMAIEREIMDLRRVQFMSGKVGRTYSGIIIGVTGFGFFVELTEVFVEGLVRVSSLTDDYYIFIEAEHKWQGQRRHRTFKIGDSVKVRVTEVDLAKRRIDLALISR
ncbi:MAG: ribonuclease R [Nitrospinaceae bacterium]